MAATHHVADLDFHKVAAAQFAVDRKIEQRAIPQTFVFIEKEADSPNVARFERPLRATFWPAFQGRRS